MSKKIRVYRIYEISTNCQQNIMAGEVRRPKNMRISAPMNSKHAIIF